ncbi:hypothetical protein G6N05_14450 [Flavobacterium sp. F372]|jgi:hypothetical protein|uniref:Lipoprotein n=1 Tax=Flavobacterium bernardetii TaxID=2813823 RepID=A0ABR7J282_9FLAO|nr:DUF6146 family protein [Flavobacterium bernardetii]MBC5836128.1 hypothetical protein [Flavobacterium bernardetii]NHF71313.1 hypothetical protein [Flavobacterium bernardetii]
MKKLLFFGIIASFFIFSCNSNKKFSSENTEKLKSDTIHISNPDLEYDVIIIDAGFSTWFNSYAKPKGFYSQSYLEARNRTWIMEWNNRARNPIRYGNIFDMTIDYDNTTNYGYHVNYMIYNYLVYFQLTNKQQLGGFQARL